MKKILTLSLLALVAAMTVGTAARAGTINGNITFVGGLALDNVDFLAATGVSSFVETSVKSIDGDFVPMIAKGDAVAFPASWSFNSGAVAPFWSVGGFTFNLSSSWVTFHDSDSINVKGNGWITGNGFEATEGYWNFSTQNIAADGQFSFSASSKSVPDNGASIVLLGLGLTGVGAIARRQKAA